MIQIYQEIICHKLARSSQEGVDSERQAAAARNGQKYTEQL